MKKGIKKHLLLMGSIFVCMAGGVFLAEKEVRAEGEITVWREAGGDLEQLQAIEISEESFEEWRQAEAIHNVQGRATAEEKKFLSCGSDYGYRDMIKRSHGEGRQYVYRELEKICNNFTVNGVDGIAYTLGGKTYYEAGVVDLSSLGYSMTSHELLEIYFTFRNDNPQYFWLNNTVLYSGTGIVPLTYDAYQNGEVRSKVFDEIMNTARQVYWSKASVNNSKYENILTIYDTLIADIEYSYNTSIPTAHSIAGAMTSAKSAVCEGYAKVMQLMMNYYNIYNIYVTGDAGGGHAWNMVRMDDNKYYWLDATWDDQEYEQFQHQYFLVGNEDFGDHTPDLPEGTAGNFLYELPNASETRYVYDPQNPVEPVITKGDVNLDGKVTMADLILCLHHVSARTELEGDAFLAADIDENKTIAMTDIMKILHYVSGRTTTL